MMESSPPRSGGKIMRPRRVSSKAIRTLTPYSRPSTPTRISNDSQNPNWLRKLIFSPSRILASGAGKLFSSVFSPSSSDSEEDSDSDDEDTDADDSVPGIDGVDEMIDKGSQPILWKKETKKLIEQLIMQEAFSSEECNRLIRIIKSRVVDLPIVENTRRDGNYEEMPDISSAAVMEAKKWLEEKRLGSTSYQGFDQGTGSLTPNMLPNVVQGEAGSPVDVAKSYMQARPLWASPSVNDIGYRSPSPTGLQLFKEQTLSSSKLKKGSFVSGSWSIQDEIRRVRSKATEEMLKSLPSARIDWSELALGSKNIQSSAEKPDTRTAGVAISLRNSECQDGSKDILSSGKKLKLSDSSAVAVSIDGPKDTIGISQQLGSVGERTLQDLVLHEKEHSLSNVVAGTKDPIPANGVHNVGSSMSEFQDPENYHRQPDHQNLDKAADSVEACELLSETSVDVPFNNEQDGLVTGSQDSSSGQYEEPLQELSHADTKLSSGETIRRSKRKTGSKYSRSSRGRGN